MKFNKIFSTANIWLLISLGINIYQLFLPLTNILSYEFSAANGIIQSLVSGIWFLHFFDNELNISKALKKTITYSVINFTIIFLLGFFSTIIFQGCPFDETLLFYFLIPPVSILIAISTAVAASNKNNFVGYLFFSIIWFLLLISFLIDIYYYSQIYFYNPILGYFPGTIYDEDIPINSQFVFYRLILLVISISFLVIITKVKLKRKQSLRVIVKIFFILLLIVVEYLKPSINLATDSGRLKEILSKNISTEHYEIFADPLISNDDLNYLASLHEFYHNELIETIETEPDKKIISFIFKDGIQKRQLFGSNNANVAKPWMKQIFLNPEQVENSLKHELVHIFTADFGWSIFEVAKFFNPALIEGFAMAFEDDYGNHSVDYMAKLARENDYHFRISDLFSGLNFFTSTSSISYIYAGSFIKYLKQNFGVNSIKDLYRTGDFELVFGTDINVIQDKYYFYLDSLEIDFSSAESHYYFGRPSIFKKYCARYAANEINGAWSDYRSGAYEKSLNRFEGIYEITQNYSSFKGIILSLGKLNKFNEAVSIIVNSQFEFNETAYQYDLNLTLADYLIKENEFERAKIILHEILNNPPTDEYYFHSYRWSKICNSETDTIISFAFGSEYDRYKLLMEIYKKGKDILLVPSLVMYSKLLNENIDNFRNELGKIDNPQTKYESKALYILSEYLKSKYDYAQSLSVLEKAQLYKADFELNKKYNEFEKMLNWLKSYKISE